MQTSHEPASTIDAWLDHLRQLYPVQMLVHVGAGQGHELALYERWAVERLLLVEADADLHTRLLPRVAGRPGWHAEAALLAEQEATVPFHVSNNLNESATLPPSDLVGAWRNLKLKTTRQLGALTLPTLLARVSLKAPQINWLMVDCLPALPVLKGAGNLIAAVDVVVARVALEGAQLPSDRGAAEAEVSAWLAQQGFSRLALEQENHPAFGKALYVRAWQAVARKAHSRAVQFAKARDEQTTLALTRQNELQALSKAKAESDRAVQESKAQVEALTATKAEAEQLATERAGQIQQLTRACDEQAKLAMSRKSEIQTLTTAKAESDKAARESKVQIEGLTAAKAAADKVAADRAAQVLQLTQARDEQAKLAMTRQSDLDAMTTAMADADKAKEESKAQLAALTSAITRAEKLAAESAIHIQLLTQARDEQAELAVARLSELQALSAAKVESDKAAQAGKAQVEALTVAKARADTLAIDRARQIEELTQARDEQAKLAMSRRSEMQELSTAKTEADKAVRESRAQVEALTLAKDASERLAAEQASQIQLLTRESELQTLANTEFDKAAQELKAQIEALTVAAAAAERVAVERAAQIQQLTQARDEQAKLAMSRQGELQALIAAKAESDKASLERKSQLDTVTKQREEAIQQRNEHEKSRKEQEKIASERHEAYEQLKLQLSRQEAALDQLQREMNSANDADIETFLNDLEILFLGQQITYVDVGAYTGDVFLKISKSGKLRLRQSHLIEPNPNAFSILSKRVDGIVGVHLYNLSAGSSNETATFLNNKSMTKAVPALLGGPADAFTATAVTLDQLKPYLTDGKVNLLKLDVEGAEVDVLAGATGLLEEGLIDVIYVEVGFNIQGTQQTYFAQIDRVLQGFGYRVGRIYEQRGEWIDGSPLLRRCNFSYLSARFAAMNPINLKRELVQLRRKLDGNAHKS